MNMSLNLTSNLEKENWRGEGRWECNTINALLKGGKQVHTTRNFWRSPEPMPSNLYDGLNESWLPESVLMVHGAGRSLYIERDDARAYIVQFHEPPFGQAKEDFLRYLSQNRIIATVASMNQFIYNKLAGPFGRENVYHIAGAMVPYVIEDADNFRKPRVTWAYRNFRSFLEEKPSDINNLFSFLEPIMKAEPELRVSIIVGLWDTTRFGTVPSATDIRNWALSAPVMQAYRHLFDRIDIHVNLHWNEVLRLLEETRWIISPAEPLGCPAYEAAMFGIPTIVNNAISPFVTLNGGSCFPELLTSPRSIGPSFLGNLQRLQNDHAFYRKTGDAYRKYTREHATFESFVREIDAIVTARGWDS